MGGSPHTLSGMVCLVMLSGMVCLVIKSFYGVPATGGGGRCPAAAAKARMIVGKAAKAVGTSQQACDEGDQQLLDAAAFRANHGPNPWRQRGRWNRVGERSGSHALNGQQALEGCGPAAAWHTLAPQQRAALQPPTPCGGLAGPLKVRVTSRGHLPRTAHPPAGSGQYARLLVVG